MNWWPSKKSVSFLIIAALYSFIACKKGDEVSSQIQPKVEALSALYEDTFRLKTTVVYYDSFQTNNSVRLLVGVHNDPKFGKVTATGFSRFGLRGLFTSFGPNTVLDSVYFEITLGINAQQPPYFYGKRDDSVKVKIYRLTEEIPNETFYAKRAFAFNDLLSETTLKVPVDSVNDERIYVGINRILGEEFLQNQGNFGSVASFQDMFKGIAIVPDANSTAIIGVYNIRMFIVFHNYFGINNLYVKDSTDLPVSFPSNGQAGQNQFIVDRSSSELASLSPDSQNFDSLSTEVFMGKCYIQPNTGIFTKVEFPSLELFKQRVDGKILINKAELVIIPDTSDKANGYNIPFNLYAYELNNARTIKKSSTGASKFLQNELSGIYANNNPLIITYNRTNGNYIFTLTTYLQALLDGNIENNGLLIGGYNNLLFASSGTIPYGTIDRLNFYNQPGQSANIKLRVFYTPYK